jgi:hypothetical protein
MTKPDQELEDLIEEILKRTLDELSDWVPVKLMPGVGPQHPQVHFEFETKLKAYRKNVRLMLGRKTIEELRSDYLKSTENVHNPLTQPHGVHFQLCKELNCLKKTRPPWFGSGWSEQSHLLDVGYWIATTTLSINEAALLMVGVDPRKVNYEALFGWYGNDVRTDDVLYFLEDCFELLVRRFGDPDDGLVVIDLGEFCTWVEGSGRTVSNELEEIIKQQNLGVVTGSRKRGSPSQDKSLHGTSRSMFQRALLAVAIDHYGFKEKTDSARVANAIVEAGAKIAFSLDKENLAKQIRAGFVQVDEKEWAEWLKIQDENSY